MARRELENILLAAIRVRGRVEVKGSIAETLKRLNLNRVNNLILFKANKSNVGMLYKCNDYITYGEVKPEMVKMIFKKKLGKEELAEQFLAGKSFKELNLEQTIGMKPPKHGYEGVKKGFNEGGALGYRGEEINDLIKRML